MSSLLHLHQQRLIFELGGLGYELGGLFLHGDLHGGLQASLFTRSGYAPCSMNSISACLYMRSGIGSGLGVGGKAIAGAASLRAAGGRPVADSGV